MFDPYRMLIMNRYNTSNGARLTAVLLAAMMVGSAAPAAAFSLELGDVRTIPDVLEIAKDAKRNQARAASKAKEDSTAEDARKTEKADTDAKASTQRGATARIDRK